MEFVTGLEKKREVEMKELLDPEMIGKEAVVTGMVHSIRDMGEIEFVILRRHDGLIQTVVEKSDASEDLKKLHEGQAVKIYGTVRKEDRAPHGIEITLEHADILSVPSEPLPIAIDKWKLPTSLEANLDHRAIA